MNRKITLSILLFALFWVSLSAKDHSRRRRLGGQKGLFFKKFDLNKDGKISQKEYMSLFNQIDRDKDRQLDLYELDKYYKKMQKELKK